MKKRPALYLAAMLLAFVLCLSGCGQYTSSFRATVLVQSNTASSAFMEFYGFEGRMVFKIQGEGRSGWRVRYTARLESGSATISYIDENQEKIEVCTVAAGDEIESVFGGFDQSLVRIIVETSEKCGNGSFHFDRE